MASASALALAFRAVAAFAVSASAMAATSAASAAVYIFSMKAFCQFLLCSLAYRNHFSCEMEGLACHSVVEVHLY